MGKEWSFRLSRRLWGGMKNELPYKSLRGRLIWAGILQLITKLKSNSSWDIILWNPWKIHTLLSQGLPPCFENTAPKNAYELKFSGYYLLHHSCFSTVFMFPKNLQLSFTVKFLFLAKRPSKLVIWKYNCKNYVKKMSWFLLQVTAVSKTLLY